MKSEDCSLRETESGGVKHVKGSSICNSGEFLKVRTNDRLKSPLHRVVVNEAKTRMSTAVFLNAPDSTLVSAPSALVEGLRQERKYKGFLITDFFKGILEALAAGKYPRGEDFIAETLRIISGKGSQRLMSPTA